jgi:uncharacterized membrane protein
VISCNRSPQVASARGCTSHETIKDAVIVSGVSKQALGNALAGVLFLIVAVWDFTRDDSGIGVVFVVFAAVFLALAASGTHKRGD